LFIIGGKLTRDAAPATSRATAPKPPQSRQGADTSDLFQDRRAPPSARATTTLAGHDPGDAATSSVPEDHGPSRPKDFIAALRMAWLLLDEAIAVREGQ
jgi:hypothetical protein